MGRLVPGMWLVALLPCTAFAHNLAPSNAEFVARIDGIALPVFVYLGAKHMVTGVDHLLYLLAIMLLASRTKDLVLLVSAFAMGHSISLVASVGLSFSFDARWVDALIGLSIVYKAVENQLTGGALEAHNPRVWGAVFCFGLIHGLGLASKLQTVYPGGSGWFANLLGFNLGVELGQLMALFLLVGLLNIWRRSSSFTAQQRALNSFLMCAGFTFMGYHLLSVSLGYAL